MLTTLQDFESVWPSLVEDLLAHCRSHNLPENVLNWFHDSLNANTLGGKCNRGISVVDTISLLKSDSSLTTPSHPAFADAAALGWLIELLQAFFLVADDIMDTSITRRGQPCWYRRPGVGMIAVNDAVMLESAIFVILRTRFRQHPSYVGLVELFQDVKFRTEMGQECDLLTAPQDEVDLARFGMDKYWFIVRYKTAYYSFYLPVAVALHYCNLASAKNLQQARDVLVPMGEYFQVQDDFLDCFADAETLGKVGTDIRDNKCSWLVCQALERATPQQKKVLEESYGKKNESSEERVKGVYRELKLEQVYKEYEENVVGRMKDVIASVDESEGLKRSLFEEFLAKIYKRSK